MLAFWRPAFWIDAEVVGPPHVPIKKTAHCRTSKSTNRRVKRSWAAQWVHGAFLEGKMF